MVKIKNSFNIAWGKARKQKIFWSIFGLIILVAVVLDFKQSSIGTIRINQSGSLPYTVFWVSFGEKSVKRNELVSFYSSVQELKNILITKIVGGISGDIVSVRDGFVFINDEKIIELKKEFLEKFKVNPIESGVIPVGKIFVYALDCKSFDSRYREFGLIDEKDIVGRAYAIF